MVEQHKASDPLAELSAIFRLLRFALTLAVLGLVVWLLGDVLVVIFAATLMAVILHGIASYLKKKIGLPYQLAVALVTFLIIAAIAMLCYSSGPEIGDQFVKLKQALLTQYQAFRGQVKSSSWGQFALAHLPQSLGGTGSAGGPSIGAGLANSVTGIISSAFGLLGTLAVILISGLYFALTPSVYVDGLLRLAPPKQRPAIRALLITAGHTLWSWTIGQALDMLVVGIASALGLYLLGIPLASALGVVAGLCNFIPYIGAILGAIPAVLIALSVGTQSGLAVVGLYCVIQFLEGNVLAPLIQRHAVQMPPAVAILSQTVFGSILGVPGLILASPLMAALLAVGDKATAPLPDNMRIKSANTSAPDRTPVPKKHPAGVTKRIVKSRVVVTKKSTQGR